MYRLELPQPGVLVVGVLLLVVVAMCVIVPVHRGGRGMYATALRRGIASALLAKSDGIACTMFFGQACQVQMPGVCWSPLGGIGGTATVGWMVVGGWVGVLVVSLVSRCCGIDGRVPSLRGLRQQLPYEQ